MRTHNNSSYKFSSRHSLTAQISTLKEHSRCPINEELHSWSNLTESGYDLVLRYSDFSQSCSLRNELYLLFLSNKEFYLYSLSSMACQVWYEQSLMTVLRSFSDPIDSEQHTKHREISSTYAACCLGTYLQGHCFQHHHCHKVRGITQSQAGNMV